MNVFIDLTPEEIAELKTVTNQSDLAAAVRTAVTEYLRYARRQRLKSLSGRVKMQENWHDLEGREII